jgi:hypothetical protein
MNAGHPEALATQDSQPGPCRAGACTVSLRERDASVAHSYAILELSIFDTAHVSPYASFQVSLPSTG